MGSNHRLTVLVVDNSIAITGGIKAIVSTCRDLQSEFNFLFVLPNESLCIEWVEAQGFRCQTLPFLEIRRTWQSLLLYLPLLFINAFRLARIIRKEKVVIVHVNDLYNLCGIVARLFVNYKLITHVRILANGFPIRLYQTWVAIHRKFSNHIICVSSAAQVPFSKEPKSSVVPDRAPHTESYSYHYPPHPENNSEIRLLYLANYIPGKGQNFALAAFEQAFLRCPQLKLIFSGGDMGLSRNRAFKRSLEEKTSQGQMANAVVFKSFSSDIEKEIKDAHIVLNFSEAESFSLTCQEALFYGTPLIATDCGGPRELFEHMKSGWLVKNRDIRSMSDAITQLASDVSLRIKFSQKGRMYIREKFNRTLTSDKIAEIYKAVIKE